MNPKTTFRLKLSAAAMFRGHGAAVLRTVPLLLIGAVTARGDFSSPYALTPPAPSNHLVLASSLPAPFGDWMCLASSKALFVNTLAAPGSVALDTGPVSRPCFGHFYARATTSGTVTFDYTITGQGEGSFIWGPASPTDVLPLGSETGLVATAKSASIPVNAGDLFGFKVAATGTQSIPFDITGWRKITITNFIMHATPTISINDIVVAEGTNGTFQALFPVVMTPASPQTVTVDFATANGSAAAGSDYVATNGTLVFAPGETNKNIAVTVTADANQEADEDFFVNLTNAINASMLKPNGRAVVTEVVVKGLSVDVAVSFRTGANRFYVVEKSDDLLTWTTVPGAGNVAGTGGIVVVHDPGAGCNSQRHYRLRLLQ